MKQETTAADPANKLSESRYRGKVCEKHPEEQGARYFRNYGCVGCQRDSNKIRDRSTEAHKEARRDRRLAASYLEEVKRAEDRRVGRVADRARKLANEAGRPDEWPRYFERAAVSLAQDVARSATDASST